jgi:predicted O-methyltransferase YrrM
MRESVKDYVRACAETLPISEPIYQFGSFQVPGQEGFADLRPLFPGKKYVSADMRKGLGVDVVLNLHQIDLPSESVGTVFILDTLEHVESPSKAMSEVHRVLKPDGILIMSSVMNFPIHDYPLDYWRFTPEGFRSLLKLFATSLVHYAGESNFPHTIVGIGLKGSIPEEAMDQIKGRLRHWKGRWSSPRRKGLQELLLPPLIFDSVLAREGVKIMRDKGLATFCKRSVRLALRKAARLPGLETLDNAVMAAKLKVAEGRCKDMRDYFRLIGHAHGLFGIKNLAPVQKETEIVSLLEIALKLPVQTAVEIGTGNGGTFYLLCKAAEPDAILITIDPKNDWNRRTLLKSCSKSHQKIHVIRGKSQNEETLGKITRRLGSRKLDLLFIDGDHSWAGVAGDFEAYSRFVRRGGIIAMHDILPDYWTRYGTETQGDAGDVPRFWNTVKSKWKSRELVESYEQDGQGIGVIEWSSA